VWSAQRLPQVLAPLRAYGMEGVKQGMYSHQSAWTVLRKESESGVDRTASDTIE
jgi:hypothetical protein